MSALAKIKKTAAQHEQVRQYDKALAQYARLLDREAGADEEVDVTLYNRAGDLALRVGEVARAVTYFERAIDLYAAGGFLNNAVALAVKIRRHAPGHLAAHHTLGVLYARKGFRAEARQHLAEYAVHMQRAGRADEVRRTLGELVALGTSADEVTAARDLLAAHAATPDDAGALLESFDAALGPPSQPHSAAGCASSAPVSVPLSELIELEVRGGSRAASDTGVRAPRWATVLPGDPAPLRISVLRMAADARGADIIDHRAVHDLEADRPDTAFELLDLAATEPTPADPYEPALLDLPASELDVFESDASVFETFADESSIAERSPADAATRAPIEWETVESRQFDQARDELATSLVPLDEIEAADVPHGGDLARPAAPVAPPVDASVGSHEVTDLGEWLRSTELPPSTRLVTPAPRVSGDEAADFDAALHAFTTGIAHSVDPEDRASHYDLGVAFREMGLFADAVREFQRALAAPGAGLREREALAHCFLDLGRAELALAALEQAAADAIAAGVPGETLVGVHYVLAEAARLVGRTDDARTWYVCVLATDYGFRDAAARHAALPPPRTPAASR